MPAPPASASANSDCIRTWESMMPVEGDDRARRHCSAVPRVGLRLRPAIQDRIRHWRARSIRFSRASRVAPSAVATVNLPQRRCGMPRSAAISVQQIAAGNAQARLERIRLVMNTGMDDFAIARAGVHAEVALGLENEHFSAGACQRAAYAKADHARADHNAIDLVQGRLSLGLDRGRRRDEFIDLGARRRIAGHQANRHTGFGRCSGQR